MTKSSFNSKMASPSEAISRIVAEIDAQNRAWVEFINDLPDDLATIPADGQWTALDCLVHVTAWNENALKIARLQAQPDEPDPGPSRGPAGYLHIHVDQFNSDVFHKYRGWKKERIFAWSQQVNAELLKALGSLPSERILGGSGRYGARMWYWMPAFIHSRGHRLRAMRELLDDAKDGS